MSVTEFVNVIFLESKTTSWEPMHKGEIKVCNEDKSINMVLAVCRSQHTHLQLSLAESAPSLLNRAHVRLHEMLIASL